MDDRNSYRRPMWVPWAATSVVLLMVAFFAFAMGTRYEPAVTGGGHVHVWGPAFPGFFFGFFILWFVLGGLRRMWWWGGGYPYYRSWRYRRYYGDPHDDERDFQEWHRREHERMGGSGDRG